MSSAFHDAIVANIPDLRLFAIRLAGPNDADDLTQEALARALRYSGSFVAGTDMKAWLCRIAQNCAYRRWHRQKDTIQDVEGQCAARQSVAASQEWSLEARDTLTALDSLPEETRGALVMTAIGGLSYQEAAQAAHCPVGTLKSRINRAREQLSELGYGPPHPEKLSANTKAHPTNCILIEVPAE
ncbi:sigma-70 family RNA polymerase sigma factor [Asticcacaulis tiandongensis]|uniref:sigma-70 family RNA polymerase sigma factor n=1 Tax=Asticcacaulis tiandongensis TaxID=2565365 RepID=UPI00112B2810|nr:sigma-70 family RNA polymerase sigma factor [Asticcacaulis tiandongensis]